jgi:O-antigen/teichoic acid export membrane protein
VLRSSAALFSGNSISLGLGVLQSILAARLLGPAGFGAAAIVMGYATTINGFLSFRMSELVVRYGGEYLEKGEKAKAAAIIKAASLAEGVVSLLAFLVVALTSTLAAEYIAKDPQTAKLFIFYSLGLLANFNTETSTGVLQALGKIKFQGAINAGQSILTAGLIVFAFFTDQNLQFVLLAYLAGKTLLGVSIFSTAFYQLSIRFSGDALGGARMFLRAKTKRSEIHYKELFNFAFSSNLSATAILVFRESEILWVGYFLNSEAAGFYKAAYALAGLLAVPANPFILTTYPEINKLAAQQAWKHLKDFLKKITTVSSAYNLVLIAGFVVFGKWLLKIYGQEYSVAYPALLVLLIGLGFNYIFFWNRPLLLSLNLPHVPLRSALIAGIIKLALAFPLVPKFGYIVEAGLLSFYYIASVGANVWRGIKEIRSNEDRADH